MRLTGIISRRVARFVVDGVLQVVSLVSTLTMQQKDRLEMRKELWLI